MTPVTYNVHYVPNKSVKPSPENDAIYGKVVHDEQMYLLIESIKNRGLAEPIIISSDNYIISGHRRYYALSVLGWHKIPVYRRPISRAETMTDWAAILAEHNPQRVKSPTALLKEAMLRRRDDEPSTLINNWARAESKAKAEYTTVHGFKPIGTISEQRIPFLDAAKVVIESLEEYWPLTVRQIHYSLLNNPPLKRVVKRSAKDPEENRYRNDVASYKALVRLLKDARYTGHIPLHCIDDPTRPVYHHRGFDNLADFIQQQMDEFLVGYHRDRQVDQPRHIEVIGEKNTLVPILRPVCNEYYVPLSISRGYGTVPLWKQVASRYQESGKKAITLIVVSDYDPEGLDLPKDAVRSLTQVFGVPVDYHRVAVEREQIDDLSLASDFNPAKEDSSRLKAFIEETGGEDTWECEAIPPAYMQRRLREAIEANMDMDAYEKAQEMEAEEAKELAELRSRFVDDLTL